MSNLHRKPHVHDVHTYKIKQTQNPWRLNIPDTNLVCISMINFSNIYPPDSVQYFIFKQTLHKTLFQHISFSTIVVYFFGPLWLTEFKWYVNKVWCLSKWNRVVNHAYQNTHGCEYFGKHGSVVLITPAAAVW